jgi:putative endonuclease
MDLVWRYCKDSILRISALIAKIAPQITTTGTSYNGSTPSFLERRGEQGSLSLISRREGSKTVNYMHFVYLLKSTKNKTYYVGKTVDIDRRIKEHNSGKVYFTSRHLPYKLIYYEAYPFEVLAIEREKQLKRFSSAYYALLKRIQVK